LNYQTEADKKISVDLYRKEFDVQYCERDWQFERVVSPSFSSPAIEYFDVPKKVVIRLRK